MPYQKVCKLQSGSFSTVYKGVLTQNDQILVALKCCYKPILSPQQQQDPNIVLKYQSRLKRVFKLVNNEYEILNKLRQGLEIDYFNDGVKDNYICHMVDFLESSEFYIFVLQFCEFGDLYDHIKLLRQQQTQPASQLQTRHAPLKYFQVVNQVNHALQYAHSMGIAHRDIKPENILLDSQFNVKLTDWGLSTFNQFSLQQCIGTEKYLAPECFFPNCILKEDAESLIPNYVTQMKIEDTSLLKDDGYDTKRSDLWSLGITFLYVLFASCPFKFAAIQHPTVLKKFRNLTKEEQMATSLPENKNFQLYLNSPLTFVEEYYFQTLLKQESLSISKNTIHAAMNFQDDYHYPAFWLTILPTSDEITEGTNININEKIIVMLNYALTVLERDTSFRLWLLHQISNLITKLLMAVDYLKRDLDLFMKSLNAIYQIQLLVLREFVRQLMELPLDFVTVESIDLSQIIHNIIHIYNNQHLYTQPLHEPLQEEVEPNDHHNITQDDRESSISANKNTRGFSNMTLYETGVQHHNQHNQHHNDGEPNIHESKEMLAADNNASESTRHNNSGSLGSHNDQTQLSGNGMDHNLNQLQMQSRAHSDSNEAKIGIKLETEMDELNIG